MPFDILTFGEVPGEVMRTRIDQPLDRPAPFTGPYPSGAPSSSRAGRQAAPFTPPAAG